MNTNWYKPIFQRYRDFVGDLDRILDMSMRGMAAVSNLVTVAEVIHNIGRFWAWHFRIDKNMIDLAKAREDAIFGKPEVARGFPVLHGQAVVALWGAFEVLVQDLLFELLLNEPTILKSDTFGKLRIPLAEFEALDKEQRMRLLIRELEQDLGASVKLGIGRFEAMLKKVQLGGSLPADVKRDLLELSQVRNVLVHRASIADTRFSEMCPWLNIKPGEKIAVTHECYRRYHRALEVYMVELFDRVHRTYGAANRGSDDRSA